MIQYKKDSRKEKEHTVWEEEVEEPHMEAEDTREVILLVAEVQEAVHIHGEAALEVPYRHPEDHGILDIIQDRPEGIMAAIAVPGVDVWVL